MLTAIIRASKPVCQTKIWSFSARDGRVSTLAVVVVVVVVVVIVESRRLSIESSSDLFRLDAEMFLF